MTDVYFQGLGDWFIKTANGIRPITSKVRPLGDEHLKYLESNDVDISYTSITLRECIPFSGVFKLTPSDEKCYSIAQSKKILKKRLVEFLPSLSPGSSFLDCVEKGLLSIDDIDNCYFSIQWSAKYSMEESAKKQKFKIKILDKDDSNITDTNNLPEVKDKSPKIDSKPTLKPKNLKRIKDLNDFRLALSKDEIPLDTTKSMHLPCTQPMILKALQKWSKKEGIKEEDCIWRSLKKVMDQDLWGSDERKAIFTSLKQGNKDIDVDFFKNKLPELYL